MCCGCVGCDWVSGVAAQLCETWFPEGFLVSRQKGIPRRETSSAMRSGAGTLRFFYVACDHGWRDARGGVCWVSHLNCCLRRGEGGPDGARGFRQAVSDRRPWWCCCGRPLCSGGGPSPDGRGFPAVASAASAVVLAASSSVLQATASSAVGPGLKRDPVAHLAISCRSSGEKVLLCASHWARSPNNIQLFC